MARTKGRVVLSKNPKENLDLAQVIYNKHLELGADSPLKILEDINWAVVGPKIATTLNYHTQAEALKAESEKSYAERDKTLPEVVEALKQSIALLKASYGKNPKKLADWGVNVDDSPQVKKTKKE